MRKGFQKQARVRLNKTSYRELCFEVLQRDGWRCQYCGAREQLHVHHRQFRSHRGDDSEDNLITLCIRCHGALHGYTLDQILSRKKG
jgi:5-methylcytosine-specific restriction endonuclease McrA